MRNKLQIVKKFIIKNLLGMIIGGLIVGSISIATANYAFEGSNVYYDKSSSGGSYSNVQGALNELYGKVASGKKVYYIKNVSLTIKKHSFNFIFFIVKVKYCIDKCGIML